MKKNIKFLWLYTGILFSVALALILVATFTQTNIVRETKEIQESSMSGMQKSLTQLTEENTKLKTEINEKQKLIDEQQLIITKCKENETETILSKEIDEKIILAYETFLAGNAEEAKKMISEYNRNNLTNIQLKFVDIINK